MVEKVTGKRCFKNPIFDKMKKILLISCVVLFLLSCKNEVKKQKDIVPVETPSLDPNYEYIHMIPDSLQTKEQKNFVKKLKDVVFKYHKVVDNQMVFTLSRKEFMEMGFPEEYYNLIERGLIDNNKFFRDNNIQDVDSLFKESLKNYK